MVFERHALVGARKRLCFGFGRSLNSYSDQQFSSKQLKFDKTLNFKLDLFSFVFYLSTTFAMQKGDTQKKTQINDDGDDDDDDDDLYVMVMRISCELFVISKCFERECDVFLEIVPLETELLWGSHDETKKVSFSPKQVSLSKMSWLFVTTTLWLTEKRED